ncbi:MAG: metallophosphoesterase [bacterium]
MRPLGAATNDSIAILVGAGDVADCRTDGAPRTARLLDSVPGTIFIAGDVAYRSRRDPHPLRTCFDPAWGRHLARIRPAPGNHEYTDGDASEYFEYFGDRAGAAPGGYYSYDLGRWHVIALNTNITIDAGSPEVAWLRSDLAAHLGRCTVAYMHHPRYSSGPHSGHALVRPIWDVLVRYGVSIAIAGHDHLYERFTPMDAAGTADSAGVRQFVVGTGGARRYAVGALQPGSEAQSSDTFGLLELTLLPDRYRWTFLPADAGAFRDAGESPCHATRAER